MKPVLGRIMTIDPNLKTMSREEKDFANYRKQQVWNNIESDNQKFHKKQQNNQNITMKIMKDNVPVQEKDNKRFMNATNAKGQQVQLELDYHTTCKTNPVTGEVTVIKNGERFKAGYKPRQDIQSRHIEPDGGFRRKHEAIQDQKFEGQKLKRNVEAEDRLWRVKADEEVYKPKLSVSVVSPWNMKSDEKDLFDKRARDLERHEKIYGESTKERKLWMHKGSSEQTRKMLNQSLDYRDLELQHIKKIMPAFHESNDFPLKVAGNVDPRKSKPFPVMDGKHRKSSAKDMITHNEDREQKLLQDKKRDNGNLSHVMQNCNSEQKLLQDLKRVDHKPKYDALDKYIQSKTRSPIYDQYQKPSEKEERLMQGKRRIEEPGSMGDADYRMQKLFNLKGAKKNNEGYL